MVISIGIILLLGTALGQVFEKIGLPRLIGMLLCGIIIGPNVLNLISSGTLEISSDLRQIALIIILSRAGISLNIKTLRKMGRPALMLSFLPAVFEMTTVALVSTLLLGFTIIEGFILGSVLAAVSPAVIVPRMLSISEKGYGSKNLVPQTVMTGASLDDIFVIIVFTIFISLQSGENITVLSLLNLPITIILGIAIGIILGMILLFIFKFIKLADSIKSLIYIATALIIVPIGDVIGYSLLLSVMTMAIVIKTGDENAAEPISIALNGLWSGFEVILFVLVGAAVNLSYAVSAGPMLILVIVIGLLIRCLGVLSALVKTKLNKSERLFVIFSYLPKATVQAAIGGTALSMGFACGDMVLSGAVIAILITAPVGAFLIDSFYKKLLKKD